MTPRGNAVALGDAGGRQPLLTWKGFRKVSSMANRPYSVNSWGEMEGKRGCQLPGARLVGVFHAQGAVWGHHRAKPHSKKLSPEFLAAKSVTNGPNPLLAAACKPDV